jgi:methyl-accepting chemotaxis protein
MIDVSIKRIRSGSEIVGVTDEKFGQVLEGSKKAGILVGEIVTASNEQARGISQISKAFSSMDGVVQQNAANSEESAAASEELSAQAAQLKSMVDGLTMLVDV